MNQAFHISEDGSEIQVKYTMSYSRFQLTFYCDIPNFVATFKSSFQNSRAGLITKHLIGFFEFRGQSQPLYTNRLTNSEINF